MSSTIHSLGPKSANGLSCEVCWVDTAALVLFYGYAPECGFRLRVQACARSTARRRCFRSPGVRLSATRLTPAGSSWTRPALVAVVDASADVAPAHQQHAEATGQDGPPDHDQRADPPGGGLRIYLVRRDHDLGSDGRHGDRSGEHTVLVDQEGPDKDEDRD